MKSAIKVLAISPYPGMVPLLKEIAAEYPAVNLTINVGDLRKGVEVAQENFHANFDIIISRGGTANLLRQAVSLPVVEISTSVYDVLRALQLSGAVRERAAIVGFSNITRDAGLLKELLPGTIDIHTIENPSQVIAALQHLRNQGHSTLLCDTITYTTARDMGFNAFLITSGAESIRAAFDEVVFFCGANRQLRDENRFLRQLLHKRGSQTVVFTQTGKLFFSTLEQHHVEIMDVLREKIPQVLAGEAIKFVSQQKGTLYHIEAQRIAAKEEVYTAFFFTTSTPPIPGNRLGIRYFDCDRVESEYYNSIYNVVGYTAETYQIIDNANTSPASVFLIGEAGAGKEQTARVLYLRGEMRNRPFVQIDCDALNAKSWEYLLSNHNSPLCDTGNTLYLQNFDTLTPERRQQLLSFLLEGQVEVRNRLIFSAVTGENGQISPSTLAFINRMQCFTIELASLRTQPERITTSVNLCLNRMVMDTGSQLSGIDEEALALLQQYPWPQNYLQFRRVMDKLAMIADGPRISVADVQQALRHELSLHTVGAPSASAPFLLDLSDTLADINRKIAHMVVEQHDDNQSRAAKSLGISRTTLWRMLKDDKEEYGASE